MTLPKVNSCHRNPALTTLPTNPKLFEPQSIMIKLQVQDQHWSEWHSLQDSDPPPNLGIREDSGVSVGLHGKKQDPERRK